MLDAFIRIPGPVFLFYFFAFSILCIYIGELKIRGDDSFIYSQPDMAALDYLHAALLNGGTPLLIQTVIFKFWKKNLIVITGNGKNASVTALQGEIENLTELEKAMIDFLKYPRVLENIYKSEELVNKLQKHINLIQENLIRLHLWKNEFDLKRDRSIRKTVVSLIIAVGGTKLFCGILYNKPVGFLVTALILITIGMLIAPSIKLTRLGREYSAKMKMHFTWLKNSSDFETEDTTALLCLAVFGLGVLDNSPYGEFYRSMRVNGADSGSNDGGIDGGASGDGGGGDSGGGCGGGCGGCGGS